jgi:hypothetical protein
LLAALTAPPGSENLPGEQQAMAAFRAHVETSHRNPCRRPRMLVHTTASKLAAAAMAGGLVLASSAVVATGSLPAGAQLTVRDVFSRVGVDVPGPDEHAGTRPAGGGGNGGTGKGEDVSGLATTTEETGRDKGAQISDLASDGTSRAGESGEAGESSSDTTDSRAPVDPSDAGGAETGAEASSGAGAAAGDAAEDVPDDAGAAADDTTDNAPDQVRPTPDLPIPR